MDFSLYQINSKKTFIINKSSNLKTVEYYYNHKYILVQISFASQVHTSSNIISIFTSTC